MRLEGMGKLRARLNTLPQEVHRKIMTPATRTGAKIIEEAATLMAPVRTGALQAAMDTRMRYYRKSGHVLAIIGPRSDFIIEILSPLAGRMGLPGKRHRPSKIAHLVERGHAGPHPAPAHPFMRPAADASAGPVFAAMSSIIAQRLASLTAAYTLEGDTAPWEGVTE